MNRNFKIGGAILLLTLAIACSKKSEKSISKMDLEAVPKIFWVSKGLLIFY
jgi:hypothetical protein